ncbi:MAG: efflux transporter outer membrane subunit, partial [Proteobacteria bacterium]|nr:efflux transporter outer membrane subunit [Pseudomonadota bacterium]
MLRPLTLAAATAAALAGPLPAQAVGPNYQRPETPLTAGYRNVPAAPADSADLAVWWDSFGDPGLSRAVRRALDQNLDIAQARARILQGRARVKAATARLAPSGQVSSAAGETEQSLLSPIGAIGSRVPGFERTYDLYDVGASASWEIDLFGGLRRGREAARADAQALIAQARATQVSIAAEAADAYLQVRAYQARLAVARRQVRAQEDLVDLLTQRTRQGVAAERDLHQAQAAQEGVQASIPPLLAGLEAQANRLDVLMGAQPGTWRADLQAEAPIPTAPALSVAETPADLMRRRPDVIAAEARLIGANARIGEALAEYYPKVSISGLLGLESLDSSRLLAANAVQHQIGAGLRWRLFDFARVDAEVAAARGAKAEALAAWRAS